MTAAILHFGKEIEMCFSRFRGQGYSIHCVQNAIDFHEARHLGLDYDLVSSADSESEDCWLAADEARKSLLVPAILFRTWTQIQPLRVEDRPPGIDPADYDLVIPADALPHVWIPRLDGLIALGRRLRLASQKIIANSVRLRQETSTVIDRTHLEIERAKSLCEEIDVFKPIPNMLADRILKCQSCGENFVFLAGEQLLTQLRDAMNVPVLCDNCKLA